MAIITLSTATFSGGRELAGCISNKLRYKVVSREDIIEKVAHYRMSRNRLERAHRRQVGTLGRMDLEWKHYLIYSRAALSKEIQEGNLVYIGDGGRAALRDFPNVLHVRVAADIEQRVDNLVRRADYGMKPKNARRLIEAIDDRRGRWRRTIYEDHTKEPSEFDLVVEPGLVSIPEACALLCAKVEQPQFQTTPKSLDAIERLTIAADLRARVAMDPDVVDDDIEIGVQDGAIVVTGSVASTQNLEAIRGLLD